MKTIEYTPQGYINMRALIDHERSSFIFITGARGGGKTYGALDYAIRHQDRPFILMRRTQVQADFAGAVATSPLAANLRGGEYLEQVKTGNKNLSQINIMRDADPEPELIRTCFIVALSTVASMRGIDLTRCGLLVFDEFIKEPHERPIKEEFSAFKNAYETINRNRELQGENPLKVVALSNALDLANPYYRGFGLVNEVYKMKGEVLTDPAQGVAIYRPNSAAFTDAKKNTALYKLKGAEETLGNAWADMDLTNVKSLNLKTASPICSIDDVGFYKIHAKVYASAAKPVNAPAYSMQDRIDVAALHKRQQGVINAMFNRKVTFESVDVMLRCQEITSRL